MQKQKPPLNDPNRSGTTVTVTVNNPLTATNEELINALLKNDNLKDPRVEYINFRKEDGRVCFGVTWWVEGENKPGCFGAYGLPSCNIPGCTWFARCKQSREDY